MSTQWVAMVSFQQTTCNTITNILQIFKCKCIQNSISYISLLTFFSLCTSRYCYSQCSGGHITTASDGLQRKRPGSEAPQTHHAPPRDLCMNWMPSTRWQHIHRLHWRYSLWGKYCTQTAKPAKKLDDVWPSSGMDGTGDVTNASSTVTQTEEKQNLWSLSSMDQMENLSINMLFLSLVLLLMSQENKKLEPLLQIVHEKCVCFTTRADRLFHFYAMWLCVSRALLVSLSCGLPYWQRQTLVLHH